MEYFEIFGIIVYEKRVARKMSRKDLAVATGYSETQIGRLERGKIKNPAYKMIAEIEDTFHINMNQELESLQGNKKNNEMEEILKINKCLLIKQLSVTSNSYICSGHARIGTDAKEHKVFASES